MNNFLISFSFGIVFVIVLSFYYSFLEIKEKCGIKKRMSSVLRLTKEKNIILLLTLIIALITFCVSTFIYEKEIINILIWQLAIMILLPISYIDLKEKIIPNKLLLIGLIFTFPLLISQGFIYSSNIVTIITSALGGALIASGIFLIASFFVKDGVGAGDIKMHFVLGLLLGFVGIFNVLLYSMVISALTGIVLLVIKKKKSKDSLPLAPFSFLGVLLAILFGV